VWDESLLKTSCRTGMRTKKLRKRKTTKLEEDVVGRKIKSKNSKK